MIKKMLLTVALLSVNSIANTITLNCTQQTVSIAPGINYKVESKYQNPNIMMMVEDNNITIQSASFFAGKVISTETTYEVIKEYQGILTAINKSWDGGISTLQLDLNTNHFAKSFLYVSSAEATSGKCFRVKTRKKI